MSCAGPIVTVSPSAVIRVTGSSSSGRTPTISGSIFPTYSYFRIASSGASSVTTVYVPLSFATLLTAKTKAIS